MKKLSVLFLVYMVQMFALEVSEQGYWIGSDIDSEHCHDHFLSSVITKFLLIERAESIVDFGCGVGLYAQQFLKHHIPTEAYDGNPLTPELTEGVGKIQDLSVPFDLGKQFDWVMSLEVGEHLPKIYEQIFIENLIRHCRKGIILSWAVKEQGGLGHVNMQDNAYIKEVFGSYGFVNDIAEENRFRNFCSLPWFKKSIMIFRKSNS